MAFMVMERIDWYFLGTKLRAIDFHFLWMVTARQTEAALWRTIGNDKDLITFFGSEGRDQFALAAGYITPRYMFEPLRKCDRSFVQSQRRKVGSVFASLIKQGLASRIEIGGRVETRLMLPAIGGAK